MLDINKYPVIAGRQQAIDSQERADYYPRKVSLLLKFM
jgi:hypothetical protein